MNTVQFDFNAYMLDCATRLKDIGHTASAPKFFHANSVIGLDELLNNISIAQYPALVVLNLSEGRVGDSNRSNNYLDIPVYTAFVLGAPLHTSDPETIRLEKQKCKNIMFKILGKIRHDKVRQLNGLQFVNMLNIPYQEVGPLGAGSYGTMVNIEVTYHNGLPYNDNDWYPAE